MYSIKFKKEGNLLEKSSFIHGTIILVIVNFIVRSLGFVYKIILSRQIGPEAIGLYQMVFPFLMLLITITSAGIPLAVSQLVAKENSQKNRNGIYKILTISLLIGGLLSLILTIVVSLKIDYIILNILKNEQIYYPFLFTIPAISLITFSSILRGFFYGLRDMKPPANAQIVEQLFRIAFVLAYLFFKTPTNPILAATIGIIGVSIGEFFGLVYLVFKFNFRKLKHKKQFVKVYSPSSIRMAGKILYISIPITIGRLVSTLMQTTNSILIPQRLVLAGYSTSEAIQIFGKITGMAMPLLFLPFTVTSALAINIIPNIAEQMATNRIDDMHYHANLAIKITLIVAIPLTLIYVVFGNSLGKFIYGQEDVGQYLSIISYSTVFLCLQNTLSGILHGMGKQVIATINFLLSMIIQLYCTYFLISNPKYGIKGFFIGYMLSAFIVFLLNAITLKRFLKMPFSIIQLVIKPTLYSILSIAVIFYGFKVCFLISSNTLVSAIVSTLLGGFLYLTLLTITNTFNVKYIFKESSTFNGS